jgi:hypothetical protein
MSIDTLVERYTGDMYDDMDMNIKIVSKRMGRDFKDLQNAGFDIWGSTYPTHDVDGDIDLGNDVNVTVTLDNTYYITKRKGNNIVFGKEYKNIKEIIKQLKKETK